MSGDRVAVVVVDLADGWRREVRFGDPDHEAFLDWARFHDIDPLTVPAGTEVVRDAAGRRIVYERFVYEPPEAAPDMQAVVLTADGTDARTERVVEQGEAPPLPFPSPPRALSRCTLGSPAGERPGPNTRR